MKQKDKQLMATAYHEAGHFVAALHYDIPVHSVSIIPNEEENTAGFCRVELPDWFNPDEIVDDRTELLIQKHIVMRFAGNEAGHKGTGKNNHIGARGDYHDLVQLAMYMCGSNEEVELLLKWLHLRAKMLVKNPLNWAGIEGVAQALWDCREMTGEEARDAMKQMQEAVILRQTQNMPLQIRLVVQ